MDNSILINNVENICTKNGVSPNKAFTESGVGKDFFYNIRKGQTPSIEKVKKIADYFNVSIDYLLGNGQKNKLTVLKNDELSPALKVLYDITEDFTSEERESLVEYARLLKLKHAQPKKK